MTKELLLKAFEGVNLFDLNRFRNISRFADACVSYVLWHNDFYRETSTYPKEERLAHYWARMERYGAYVVKMIESGTPLEEIIETVKKVLGYIPESVKTLIMEYLEKYIKELIENLLNKGK